MLRRLSIYTVRKNLPLVSSVRNGAHWNKDWKAGPYPKTEAERVAAAKKYNLLPEEYEPYPDDGFGWGDYPKLPPISAHNRDHWRAWTNIEDRRDFGEPVLIYENILSEDRVEWPFKDPGHIGMSFTEQFLWFLGACSTVIAFHFLGEKLNMLHYSPRLARHMPADGPHYSYSKKDSHH